MTRRTPLRTAGSRWRVQVDEPAGDRHEFRSHPHRPPVGGASHMTVVPGTELDEVVIGRWFHLEDMGAGQYWMSVGGLHIDVRVDRDGHPRHVFVRGVEDPRDGCTYETDGTP